MTEGYKYLELLYLEFSFPAAVTKSRWDLKERL